jgi:hypothetical protein
MNKLNKSEVAAIIRLLEYGARCAVIDGEWVVTHVYPVPWDWDGYMFHGYCRPMAAEIEAAGYTL